MHRILTLSAALVLGLSPAFSQDKASVGSQEVGARIDPATTGSIGQSLSGRTRDSQNDVSPRIRVVDVDELISGGSREALNEALERSQGDIENVRAELTALSTGLPAETIDRAIATQSLSRGQLTVFVD